jgi:S-adenosylmethionine decarboxylase
LAQAISKIFIKIEKPSLVRVTKPEEASTEKSSIISAIPGLHIIANFSVADQSLLCAYESFRYFADAQIEHFKLSKVGEVYHAFPNGGYTGVVCLTESHLSIHTWPEQNYLTFDIFLSNYLKDNRDITKAFYQRVKQYFNATVVFEQTIER